MGTTTGGESNLSIAARALKVGNIYSIAYPIRKFDKMTREWPNTGCIPEEIVAFVKKEVRAEFKRRKERN